MRQRMRAECGASSARSAERIRQPCAFSGQGHGIARSGFTEEPSAARDRALTGEIDVHDAESPGVPVASLEIVQQRSREMARDVRTLPDRRMHGGPGVPASTRVRVMSRALPSSFSATTSDSLPGCRSSQMSRVVSDSCRSQPIAVRLAARRRHVELAWPVPRARRSRIRKRGDAGQGRRSLSKPARWRGHSGRLGRTGLLRVNRPRAAGATPGSSGLAGRDLLGPVDRAAGATPGGSATQPDIPGRAGATTSTEEEGAAADGHPWAGRSNPKRLDQAACDRCGPVSTDRRLLSALWMRLFTVPVGTPRIVAVLAVVWSSK